MMTPEKASLSDLKTMHKGAREKYKCAKDNIVKAQASIVLGMIDEELDRRGYDVSKLFKGYDPQERHNQ